LLKVALNTINQIKSYKLACFFYILWGNKLLHLPDINTCDGVILYIHEA
jgi:hypothetical protein